MKKLIIIAAALITLVSCEKKEVEPTKPKKEGWYYLNEEIEFNGKIVTRDSVYFFSDSATWYTTYDGYQLVDTRRYRGW